MTDPVGRSRHPIRQIAANAGVEGIIVVATVRDGQGSFGYNAQTDEYEDMVKAGVIDPTKVVRSALQNAASIAGLLLTTEAVVVDKPDAEGCRWWWWYAGHGWHGRHDVAQSPQAIRIGFAGSVSGPVTERWPGRLASRTGRWSEPLIALYCLPVQ